MGIIDAGIRFFLFLLWLAAGCTWGKIILHERRHWRAVMRRIPPARRAEAKMWIEENARTVAGWDRRLSSPITQLNTLERFGGDTSP